MDAVKSGKHIFSTSFVVGKRMDSKSLSRDIFACYKNIPQVEQDIFLNE